MARMGVWKDELGTVAARPSRDSYRHGNLRAEAILAALGLVDAHGHEALSLRRVADTVGVAHRSLYNHFSDREGLLDAVAEEGFLRLGHQLQTSRTPDEYVGTYVRFALENPRLYDLMKSRPHPTMKQKPTLQAAVHVGITEALRLFARSQHTSEENRRAVMKVMVLLHGGIALHRAGILDVSDDAGLIAELQAMIRTS